MKKLILSIAIFLSFTVPVSAMDFTAPEAPEAARPYMPEDTESFGEGVWYIIKAAISDLQPSIQQASGICLSIISVVVLLSVLGGFSNTANAAAGLIAALTIGTLALDATNSFIQLGTQTVTQVSEYGKLLLPVMSAAMAAQGGVTASASLYAGTMLFNTFLTSLISKAAVPMIYIYLVLCIAGSAFPDDVLKSFKRLLKWVITWAVKLVLYVFTGYISITGVVSGSADAAAVKAAKLAISGAVPVVGSVLSDASETILVSAGIMKNAAGVYGLLATLAICIGPFLKIGIQYLLLKMTAAVCSIFGSKQTCGLIEDLSAVMGLLLAMTGTVCLLLLISIVCFIRGTG